MNIKKIVEYFSNEISISLNNENLPIPLIGLTGSLSPSLTEGDIDLFAILSSNEKRTFHIVQLHQNLIDVIQHVIKQIKQKYDFDIITFTEFRLEEAQRYIATRQGAKNYLMLHLKIYPTIGSIKNWQVSAVASDYFSNIKKVIYHSEPLNDIYHRIMKEVEDVNELDRYAFLEMLLFESIELLELNGTCSDYVLMECFNKLKYSLKYLIILASGNTTMSSNEQGFWEKLDPSQIYNEEILTKVYFSLIRTNFSVVGLNKEELSSNLLLLLKHVNSKTDEINNEHTSKNSQTLSGNI